MEIHNFTLKFKTVATGVSYVENTLGTVNVAYSVIGFSSANFLSGEVGGRFNAGNFQNFGDHAITGIGMVPVDEPGGYPPSTPHVLLGVPALLGTLTTPPGLGEADFEPAGAGLLNAANDGYYTSSIGEITITHEVNSILEPATLSLLVLGGVGMLRKRRGVRSK